MTAIEQRIEADYQVAVKAKNTEVLGVLRLVKAAITNEKIANKRADFTEEDLIKILRREAKKRHDSAQIYQQGNRSDLADKELKEIEIIKRYLPEELNDSDIAKLIEGVIKENNFTPPDFGQAMKLVMAKVAGQADGAKISRLLKEFLSKAS